jgi:anti-sigma factor RsiW
VTDGPGASRPCAWGELLSAYLDGELTAADHRRVDAHLAEHAACRDELAGVAGVREAVRGLPWVDGPAELWSDLALAMTVGSDPSRRLADPAVRLARWRWAAAAAAGLMVVAGVAGQHVDHATPTPTPSHSLATVRPSA